MGITDDRYIHGYVHIVLCNCGSHMGIYEGLQMKVTPAGVITNKDGTVSFVIFGEDGEVLYCKDKEQFKKALEAEDK